MRNLRASSRCFRCTAARTGARSKIGFRVHAFQDMTLAEPIHLTWPAGTRLLQVDDVQIDLRYRRVVRPEQDAELPQRMFDLLLLFLAEPHVLHSRADLFARVWPGVIVEDANLSQSVWMLRKALGESRKHWIRTVAKSGYVFEPPQPVTVVELPVAETPINKVADPAASAVP